MTMERMRSCWLGDVAMAPGIGIFRGRAGDNREHHHWAHQISLGLEGPVRLMIGGELREAAALFIRAGTPHQLLPGLVLSCYIDPTSAEARAIDVMLGSDEAVLALPDALTATIRTALADEQDLDGGLQRLRVALQGQPLPTINADLSEVLHALERELAGQTNVNRRTLADLVGLSESRFSHWFREHTGMPLRSYRKWLRLVRGVEHVVRGRPLTEAAHDADFADQAHFTRSFVELFGVKPSALFKYLTTEATKQPR